MHGKRPSRLDDDGKNLSDAHPSTEILDDNRPPSPYPRPPSSPLMPYIGLDLHLQGLKYHNNSQYADSENLFRQASKERLDKLGPHDYRTLCSRGMLAMSVWYGRKYDKVEMMFRKLAEHCKDGFGEIEDREEDYKTWLGMALAAQKKSKEAEEVFREALKDSSRGSHRSRLELKLELAKVLYNQARYAEAENILISLKTERYVSNCWVFKIVKGTQDNKRDNLLAKTLLKQGKFDMARIIAPTTVELCNYRVPADQNYESTQVRLPGTQRDTRNHYEEPADKDKQKIQTRLRETQQSTPSRSQRPANRDNQTQVQLEETRQDSPNESKEPTDRESQGTQTRLRETQQNAHSQFQGPADRDTQETPTKLGEKQQETRSCSQGSADTDNQKTEVQLEETPQDTPNNTEPQDAEEIRNAALARHLDKFFMPHEGRRPPYSDSEIYEISNLLENFKQSWSRVPRTYIVLRTIGCLHLLDALIEDNFSDYWFPVAETRVPSCLSPRIRASFVQNQDLILTKSVDLEKMDGQHQNYDDGEFLPFHSKGILGGGGFGQVDEVLSLISFKVYARKQVPRWQIDHSGKSNKAMARIIAEIEIMKKVKHDHAVRIVGSYTDPNYVGIIISPVAEMDLAAYLKHVGRSRHPELRTFFGCLATALNYLHRRRIRHKDIKPGNILVNRGTVLLTDFGLSNDLSDAERSMTMGKVDAMTPKYCAPEVARQEPRNSSSDIWSLGVVFLEMAVVLKDRKIREMTDFFRDRGSEYGFVRHGLDSLPEFLAVLKGEEDPSDNLVFPWIQDMLQFEQTKRPTAASLAIQITNSTRDGRSDYSFCGICCMNPFNHQEPDSQDEEEMADVAFFDALGHQVV